MTKGVGILLTRTELGEEERKKEDNDDTDDEEEKDQCLQFSSDCKTKYRRVWVFCLFLFCFSFLGHAAKQIA